MRRSSRQLSLFEPAPEGEARPPGRPARARRRPVTEDSLVPPLEHLLMDAVAPDAVARDAVARDAVARDARDAVAPELPPPPGDGGAVDGSPAVDEATRRAARELASDLVLRAGAGTGKTHTLVQVVVHLVAGTTRLGRRVLPGRILMLTFSEKAAAELRARVRARLLQLADDPRGDAALTETAARAGSAPLDAADWRAAAAALGAAPITTFHGFAAGLLRRHAAAAGLDPAFRLLDEDEARPLLRARAEEAVLAALEGRVPGCSVDDARALVRELDFSRGEDGLGRGLVEHVIDVLERLREEGRAPEELAGAGDDPHAATAAHRAARGAYATALDDLLEALGGRGSAGIAAKRAALGAARADVAEALERLGPDRDALEDPALRTVLAATRGSLGTDARREAQRRLREAERVLREAHVAWRSAPLQTALVALVAATARAYDAAKVVLGALDFADLVVRARAILGADHSVRRDEQARADAVLVDEFQDTNGLQDELVRLVRAPGAPLLVVGDPKQSIYEFRGADVAVFDRVAARVADAGGQARALTESRRGRAPLTDFVNRLFARAMRGGAHPFEIAFDPERDALHAHRGGDGPCVELLEPPPVDRAADASGPAATPAHPPGPTLASRDVAGPAAPREAPDEPALVARAIRDLVRSGRPVVWAPTAAGETPRAARWGDVALLLRRFTHLDAYLAELRRAGVPHYVVNGRGFHEAQEIRDLVHALTLLDDPDDALALLGVLRSPLVALSDTALVILAELAPGRSLALAPLLARDFTPPSALGAAEASRLLAFLRLYRRLRAHADRLGASGVLRALLDETDLPAVLATTWYGEQKIANLERLLALAARHDEDGRGDRRAFVRRLRALAARERDRSPPAQILGEGHDVVRVMTVHQSKGLEFPVVVLPECGARERDRGGAVAYDREVGLGLRLRLADGERVPSPRARAVEELRRARAQAESVRLFYVATTRARDLLILSGRAKGSSPCWRRHVDELLADDPTAGALVRVVVPGARPGRDGPLAVEDPVGATGARTPGSGSPEPAAGVVRDPAGARPSSGVPEPAPLPLPAAALIAPRRDVPALRALAPPSTGARLLVAPVTQLGDFVDCPRRYHLRHEVGLDEPPAPPGASAATWTHEGAPLRLDAAARGTLAHRLLERLDLADWRARGVAALDAVLAAEGHTPPWPRDVETVRAQVTTFLRTPFGRDLAARPDEMIRRELSFTLAVGGAGTPRLLVKGQIDLVLVDADAVTVVDYKLVRDLDDDAHRFQLHTYAAAARALWGRPVRAGLVRLQDRDPTPSLAFVPDAELDRCLEQLGSIGAGLAEARRAGRYAGRPRATCESLGCGFVFRCHPDAR